MNIYIYYEIVLKVHNKKKMKKDKEKIKTQNKNTFKTTLNYYITQLSEDTVKSEQQMLDSEG